MSSEKLIYMANQIAGFFKTQPADEVVEGIAKHINDFWEPRMRAQLFEIARAKENGLQDVVLQAIPLIRKPPAT